MKRAQGMPVRRSHLWPACNKKTQAAVTTGTPEHPAFPARVGYGLWRALPGVPGLIAPVTSRNVSQSLISASGDQDHTLSPSVSALLVRSRTRPSHPALHVS